MIVKELITELLNCDMKSKIELKTINVDKDGVTHLYDVHSIDKTIVHDQEQSTFITRILFKNYDFERESKLEQEPCDDAISRQAVLAIVGDSCLDCGIKMEVEE